MEGQYIQRGEIWNFIGGFGTYDVDAKEHDVIPDFGVDEKFSFSRKQYTGYGYFNFVFPEHVTWTLGLGYDSFDEDPTSEHQASPKAGVQWDITDNLRLRAAAFKSVKRALVVNQTIEPTQIAGFNQFLDDFNGTKADLYGIGLDARLASSLYGGIEAAHRNLDFPVAFGDGLTEDRDENRYSAYLYWTPLSDVAISTGYTYQEFKNHNAADADVPKSIKTTTVPLILRYFNAFGIFAELGGTLLHQDVDRKPASDLSDGGETVFLMDAALGYRLPKRRGIVSIEVVNLLDQHFDFQDDNFQNAETRQAQFLPDRSVLARLTLTF